MQVAVLLAGLITGALACAVLEKGSRWSYRQERFIEAILKQEISHQVAERSKQLGEALANVNMSLPAVRLELGQVFAERYHLTRKLGEGGMGAVFEVERLTDKQRLALKVVTGSISGAHAARFAREAEIGSRLRHQNLVQIVDVGVSAAGAPYLVMELVQGGSLADASSKFGQRTWAVGVLRQIAAGLGALHAAGVVHRDLKPANVLLTGDDAAPLARISDFGISRFGSLEDSDPLGDTAEAAPANSLKGQALTRTGALIGTPLYMPPEAIRGGKEMGPPADIYALGLIAYEALSGKLPFTVSPVMELMAGRPIPAIPPLPASEPLAPLVLRCLAPSPEQRPTLEDLAAALR